MEREKWINRHPAFVLIGVFMLFVLFDACSNWSLLLGENFMKYDIWDAEYPTQILMTDALASGTIPLWNPLMRFGSPYYAVLGSPVWYPPTMLLALVFGYSPHILAASYVMHIAIGQFGMFLLAEKELEKRGKYRSVSGLCAGIVAGLLYGGSGVFLSNAQHIMIIISAAWIPYLFYFTQRYLTENRYTFLLLAGTCGGLILVGGYPELFYHAFLFLVPYTLYFCFWEEERKTFLLTALKKFVLLCMCTVAAGAVTLIPFFCHMEQITRVNGFGQIPNTYTFGTLLSFIFPQVTQFIPGLEPSMVNEYLGLFTVLLLPVLLVRKTKNKPVYLGFAIAAFWLCRRDSFLHNLFYRILPMYQNFRFPTLARVFVALFLLLAAVPVIEDIFSGKIAENMLAFTKRMLAFTLIAAVLAAFIGNCAQIEKNQEMLMFSESAFTAACLMGLYLFVFSWINTQQTAGRMQKAAVIGVVMFELLTFSTLEGPITVTLYHSTDYCSNPAVRAAVEHEYARVQNRVREVNFAGHKRSSSGLNSQEIVFQKTFDEDGYISFLLQRIEEFKDTYRRSIMEANPVIYFTNNIVTSSEVDYEQWKDRADAAPEQIFLDNASWQEELTGNAPVPNGQNAFYLLYPETSEREEIPAVIQDGAMVLEGMFSAGAEKTENIRLYFPEHNAAPGETIDLLLLFLDREGNPSWYEGEFLLKREDAQPYAEIYFPKIHTEYQKICISSAKQLPERAELAVRERMTADPCVNVSYFGFNRIELTVDAPEEGIVTFLQANHSGWSAYIDGNRQDILTVNRCFMGLPVDRGSHSIVMKFRPTDFFAGAAISVLYLLTTAAAGIYSIRRKRKAVSA